MTGEEAGPRTDPAPLEVMVIEMKVAALRIPPHDTGGLEVNTKVCTVTESLASLATPSVQPTSVTVTAATDGVIKPKTSITIEELSGVCGTI